MKCPESIREVRLDSSEKDDGSKEINPLHSVTEVKDFNIGTCLKNERERCLHT